MEIKISETAEKQLSRFKNIDVWSVSDFVEDCINEEDYQDYLKETYGNVSSEFYDSENKVLIYTEIDKENEIAEVLSVKRIY